MNMSGNLLNKNELREYIGVSKGTIDNWMKANKIQYIAEQKEPILSCKPVTPLYLKNSMFYPYISARL